MTPRERIKMLCRERGISLSLLEKEMGYGNGSLAKANSLKDDRIVEIADFFGISADFLLGRVDDGSSYYMDPEAAAMAQELKTRPEMKVLFDATRNVSPDDIQFVIDMLDRMKK